MSWASGRRSISSRLQPSQFPAKASRARARSAGTLSGGGNIVITIGKDCLISANAGTGIPLGDRCTIEAGLYITPGTVVQIMDEEKNFLKLVKASELAGQSEMLFLRNSQNGIVECRTNRKAIELNETLHSHN